MLIKVCGITTVEDACLVAQAGADYIGVIIGANDSPRSLNIEKALMICKQSILPVVILLFNQNVGKILEVVAFLNPYVLQLAGQESPDLVGILKKKIPCQVWKSVHLPRRGLGEINVAQCQETVKSFVDAGVDGIILDTMVDSTQQSPIRYGGTGQPNDWTIARQLVKISPAPILLAGGINPENVLHAISEVHPYGIDLSSGVEFKPGRKDPDKLRRLVSAVRGYHSLV